jgi:hypothetical protein
MTIMGSGHAALVSCNKALTLLARSRYREMRELILPLLPSLQDQKNVLVLGIAHLLLLPPAAHLSDWTAWDHHLEATLKLFSKTKVQHRDVATTADHAGQLAKGAGQIDRAQQILEFAFEHYRALGDEQRASQLATELGFNSNN